MSTVTDALPISKKDIMNLLNTLVPPGMIAWFNLTAAPDGWVICDGKFYSADGTQSSTTKTSTCTVSTPNLIGRYPLGDNSEDVGDPVPAGLPNITGTGWGVGHPSAGGGAITIGEMTTPSPTPNPWNGGWLGYNANPFWFNAHDSDPIYGSSTTVTPPSVRLLPCMKL